MVISLRPISRLKKTVHAVPDSGALAKSRARVDLPMAGLAAITTIWPGAGRW